MYVPSYSRFERPFKPSKIVQVFHNAGTKRVSQPFECVASTKRVSQPFECVARVKVNVGSFNLGLHQLQIESTRFPTSTLPNFRRIIAKGFEEGDLHLLNLCEVGGHKQGLPACCIEADSVVDGALTKDEYGTHAEQAYMSIWHNTGDSHPSGTSLTKQDVRVKSLESSSVAQFALRPSCGKLFGWTFDSSLPCPIE